MKQKAEDRRSMILTSVLIITLTLIQNITSYPLSADKREVISHGSSDFDMRRRLQRSTGLAAADFAGDSIGNPENKSWSCPFQLSEPCTFTMPVTIEITEYWYNTDKISDLTQRELVMQAAKKWEAVTGNLRFDWVTPGQRADIEVFFAFIDGQHKVVGKASDPSPDSPQATWVRLDDQENWSTEELPTGSDEYSLPMTLLHEFGHAIGLRHSDNDDDVMYVQLIEDKRPILSIGDVWAAQRFYGSFRVVPLKTTARIPMIPPSVTPELNVIPEATPLVPFVRPPLSSNPRDTPSAGIIIIDGDLPAPLLPGVPSAPPAPDG